MADTIVRPNADGTNTAWSGTISPDWDNVDEAETQPGTAALDGNELSTSGGAGTAVQDVAFGTFTASGSVTKVAVWARAADQNGNLAASQTTVQVFMGGAWQTAQNSGWTSTEAWHSYTFTGTWAQADLDALQVRFTCTRTGMVMAPMRLKCLYCVVTDGAAGGAAASGAMAFFLF